MTSNRKSLSYKWIFNVLVFVATATILIVCIQGVFKQGVSVHTMINTALSYVSPGATVQRPHHIECPDVLTNMMRGHWKTRPLAETERREMMAFLFDARTRQNFPSNDQRTDGRCGNVTHGSQWFRALCDPEGSTPCCYHNTCVMKSVEDCVCEDCYDMRPMKHAEYSTWIPSHPGCPYKEHSPQEACDILNGTTILFIGDSLVRHLYTAMLLLVTGNMKDGAMQPNIKTDKRKLCQGMYMFTEKECRLHLNNNLQACNGTVKLVLLYYFTSGYGLTFKQVVAGAKEKTLIISGIGVHNFFNHAAVQTQFLLPTLQFLQNRTWPKLIWASTHAPGIRKSPTITSQQYSNFKKYNFEMEHFLNSWKIPIFDTFNLTDGMMSFDGLHYGMGMNIAKANILVSYIEELRAKQNW